ncbi:MAG: EFR1 family ferrodoxin [Candidatus Bruticola sp.]
MIFYFSATGNSQYTAERAAKAHADKVISITDCLKLDAMHYELAEGEPLGIVCPTYCWGLPTIVAEFLKKVEIKAPSKPYVYLIATYGMTPGGIGEFANEILSAKGLAIDAYFGTSMPDTWTPYFNLSDPQYVQEVSDQAEPQIDFIVDKIAHKISGDFMKRKIPAFLAKLVYKIFYSYIRQTKNFHVEKNCIGCGFCVKKCPIQAIELQNKKPVWVKKECVMCLGCLHRCPKFAIQYGNSTKKHGQYYNKHVKIVRDR